MRVDHSALLRSELTSFAWSSVLTVLGTVRFDHFIITRITSDGKVYGNCVVAGFNDAQDAWNTLFFLFQGHLPCQLFNQFVLDDATRTIEKHPHHFEEAWFAVIAECGVGSRSWNNSSCLTLGFRKTLANFSRKMPQHYAGLNRSFCFYRKCPKPRPLSKEQRISLELRSFRRFDWLHFVLDMPLCFGGVRGFSQWSVSTQKPNDYSLGLRRS